MGLAASQAKLLTITSRIHDAEFEAQSIMNKKVALATQKDQLYDEYCRALDAKKIQVAYTGIAGTLNYVDATFASVCGFSKNRLDTFALMDSQTGQMVVDDDVYEAYQEFQGGDKYAFAYEMIGFDFADGFSKNEMGDSRFIGINMTGEYCYDGNDYEYSGQFTDATTGNPVGYVLMSDVEASVYNNHKDELSSAMQKFKDVLGADNKADAKDVQAAIDVFRKALYGNTQYTQEIFKGMTDNSESDAEDFGNFAEEFNYYAKLFEGIESAGGCVPVSKYANGEVNDNDWFSRVVQTGKLILNQYVDGAKKGWQAISPATCTSIKEVSDDVAIKKAEAWYQHELSVINNKDKRYDKDLEKLETERTALKTEMDSIKKVEDENIQRTFGIFS